MPVAPRANPEDLFPPEQWKALSERSRWRGLWLVAHCWGVIGITMAVGTTWPVLIPLCVMVIGTRQLGLFILMHDAAHALLHPNRKINDWVGRWLCSYALDVYRPYHLKHHRFVQQPEDPDLVLSKPFPITRASLRRKLWRDISGQTFFKQRVTPSVMQLKQWLMSLGVPASPSTSTSTESTNANVSGRIKEQEVAPSSLRFWVGNAIGLAVVAAAGWGWVWWAMWALPMVCWLPLVTRIRNIAEHAMVGAPQPDPLRQARTTHANCLERAFLAPYWVNFHLEHHLLTNLPCWQLPRAHALLQANGTAERMEVQPGYRTVLVLATAGTATG